MTFDKNGHFEFLIGVATVSLLAYPQPVEMSHILRQSIVPYIGTIANFGDHSRHQKLSLLNWQKQINEPKPHIFEQYRLFEQEIEKFDDMAKIA
jgi:hypothetical protein